MVTKRYTVNLLDFLERQKNVTEKTILTLMSNLLVALEIVHQSGHVYNDLKLDNIMLQINKNHDAHVVLIDYGMATRYLDDEGNHLRH